MSFSFLLSKRKPIHIKPFPRLGAAANSSPFRSQIPCTNFTHLYNHIKHLHICITFHQREAAAHPSESAFCNSFPDIILKISFVCLQYSLKQLSRSIARASSRQSTASTFLYLRLVCSCFISFSRCCRWFTT